VVLGGQRMMKAAANTTGEVLSKGDRGDVGKRHLSQPERAKANGVHRATQIRLDRLARKAPEMHKLVAHGELSVAAAERANV